VNWTTRLRLAQLACILILFECVRLGRSMRREWNGTFTVADWFFIVAAVWSGVSSFTIQRRIVSRPKKYYSTSTPFTRWRAGNIARLWLATAVGLYGFCLKVVAGPPLVTNALFALGLLLLLVWSPGPEPDQTA